MLMGTGATFDFIARVVRQRSNWVSRQRLDWFFHLRKESRRLGQQRDRNCAFAGGGTYPTVGTA